ncbi:DNA/RNA helicase domain-containing protein [Spirillospora sp. CA-294931]|uniref:DNA/RNA helicase domain-containing protein n=1 Tax=Spirillospora sp. CA-294931 TaxID=3240042 RepID=UPI003D8CEB4A
MADLAQRLDTPGFLAGCAQRYQTITFRAVDEPEYRSWRHSWPAMVDALLRAGLGQMQIYLEFASPGGAGRIDALLLGRTAAGVPALVVIELKQWTSVEILSKLQVRLPNGVQVSHPVVQVDGYLAFLRQWFEAGEQPLVARGVVFLHNATSAQLQDLRAGRRQGQAEIALLSGEDLDSEECSEEELAERLLCVDLQPPDDQQVAAFEKVRWAPSQRLLDNVAAMLDEQQTFVLIGDQQNAFLRILDAVQRAMDQRGRAIVMVTGGPGSGKTIIAARLLARLFRHPGVNARYLSPSGTLIKQLSRAANTPAGRDLFLNPGAMLARALGGSRMAILDEAQRLRRLHNGTGLLRQIIERVPVVVLFLDERQIIRPAEGITVHEIQQLAALQGIEPHHLSLNGCFRSNGSRAYATWVDELLYETPRPWTEGDFDLGFAEDPIELQEWIDHHTAGNFSARTTAGFCWPWARDQFTLLPEVSIQWTDRAGHKCSWQAPWNADQAIGDPPIAPHRNFWATDPGGHRQIGCIYTAQGLEYDYGGVIIGPDLVYRDGGWLAQPHESHDGPMRNLSPDQYLPLALNTYRVLLTRSTRGMRIYSTDPETKHFLSALIRGQQG